MAKDKTKKDLMPEISKQFVSDIKSIIIDSGIVPSEA